MLALLFSRQSKEYKEYITVPRIGPAFPPTQGVLETVSPEDFGPDSDAGGIYPHLGALLTANFFTASEDTEEPSLSLYSAMLQRLVYSRVPAMQRRQSKSP